MEVLSISNEFGEKVNIYNVVFVAFSVISGNFSMFFDNFPSFFAQFSLFFRCFLPFFDPFFHIYYNFTIKIPQNSGMRDPAPWRFFRLRHSKDGTCNCHCATATATEPHCH
jgi:hypothetical protein